MRLIKMFSLAAIAAIAAMAFVGASSASATGSSALCTEANVLVCPAGKIYTGHIEMLATHLELLGTFLGVKGSILCTHSHILGNALGLAKPQVTHVELFSISGCKNSLGSKCTATQAKVGLVDLLKTAPNLGTATFLGNEFLLLCEGFLPINCTYGGTPELHALGTTAKAAELTATKALLKGTGKLCSEQVSGAPAGVNGEWDALYEIVLPKPIYIAE